MAVSIDHASDNELRLTITGEEAMVAFGEQLGKICKSCLGKGMATTSRRAVLV